MAVYLELSSSKAQCNKSTTTLSACPQTVSVRIKDTEEHIYNMGCTTRMDYGVNKKQEMIPRQ